MHYLNAGARVIAAQRFPAQGERRRNIQPCQPRTLSATRGCALGVQNRCDDFGGHQVEDVIDFFEDPGVDLAASDLAERQSKRVGTAHGHVF